MYTDPLSWADSQTACEGYGGNLASLESQTEQDTVNGLITVTDTWIGGNGGGADGNWSWKDGSTWDYTSWYANRPKTNGAQDCIKMKTTGLWDNVSCDNSFQYACQKAITVC